MKSKMNQTADAVRNFRWAYAGVVYLAQIFLQEANDQRQQENEWPAGQTWSEINSTSRSIFLKQARKALGIDNDEFLAAVRSGDYDVDDIYNIEYAALLPEPAKREVKDAD